ncbi:MAG: RCC1 domain-containing protein [Rickettsiales bacterium]
MSVKRTSQLQGFSMVVIAGLFAAFAIVGAAAIDRNTGTRQIDRQADAAAQLKRIGTALTNYALVNGNRYPCPASATLPTSDANYGVPVSACETGTPAGISILKLTNNSTDSNVIRGALPFTTLASFGVEAADAIDPWGNRIMYVVHRQLTAGGIGTATSGDGTTVTDRPVLIDPVANTPLNSPDFVVLSYGRDGIGATPSTATAPAIGCPAASTVLREENCDNDILFINRPSYTHSNATASTYYDDVISAYAVPESALTGAAYCWGANTYGGLGDGTTTQRLVPTAVSGGLRFAQLISAFTNSCGLTASGAAYCWGEGTYGQVGDGTNTDRYVPTAVAGGLTFKQLEAGYGNSCAITNAGIAYCWGYNAYGALGDNSTINKNTPTAVSGGFTFSQIQTHGDGVGTCALTPAGAAYCWGDNSNGAIGDGTTTQRLVPTAVSGGLLFTQISSSGSGTCGLTAAGVAYCWGANFSGRVGDGTTTTPRTSPTLVSGGLTFTQISTGGNLTCGLTSVGAAYCWGLNNSGQIGDGTIVNKSVPTPVSGGIVFTQLSVFNGIACGIDTARTAYCWGRNTSGQLGDGTLTSRSTPTLVSGALPFSQISAVNGKTCAR